MLTAGIIIIGDEILNGRVTDSISPFLCQRFHAIGIRTKRISVVADDIDMIALDVKSFSDSFDIVVTTGGVGPTHDDVTYEAVAKAFGTALRVDDQMRNLFAWYMNDKDPSAEKLITIPSIAESLVIDLEVRLEGPTSKYPVVRTKNVYNFPGIPSYTKTLFAAMERKYFQDSANFFLSREIYLFVDEIQVLPVLNGIVAEYQNRVSFGSYPLIDDRRDEGYETKISLESSSLIDCLNAETELLLRLPPQWYAPAKKQKPNLDLLGKLMLSDCELAASLKSSYQVNMSGRCLIITFLFFCIVNLVFADAKNDI